VRNDPALTPQEAEVEPNNSPARATLIAPNTTVLGRIGQRLDRLHGDVDFFKLSPIPSGRWRLRVELTPQPNIDTVVEVFRQGIERAVFVAREARVGQTEVVAGLALQPHAQYFISVHEDETTSVPSENVTDTYSLRYMLLPANDDYESEPNDHQDLASVLAIDAARHGYIENAGDVDVWCPSAMASAMRFRVSPPAQLDIEVAVLYRDGRATEIIDSAQAGEAEIATLRPATQPPCLRIRASQTHRQERGDPIHPYTIEPISL
jgi:hypothetical protein